MCEVSLPETVAGGRLGVSWGVGNQLLLHAKPGKQGQKGGTARCHEVRWETTLYEPVFRKLVNESMGVFLSLAKQSEEERVVGLEGRVGAVDRVVRVGS